MERVQQSESEQWMKLEMQVLQCVVGDGYTHLECRDVRSDSKGTRRLFTLGYMVWSPVRQRTAAKDYGGPLVDMVWSPVWQRTVAKDCGKGLWQRLWWPSGGQGLVSCVAKDCGKGLWQRLW